jgi:hypothetical protein
MDRDWADDSSGRSGSRGPDRPGPPADVPGAVVALFVGALCGLIAATLTFLVP